MLTDQGRDGSGWKDEEEEEENEELEVYIINTHIYMKFTRKNRKRKKQESKSVYQERALPQRSDLSHFPNQAWWSVLVHSAAGRWRQED